MQASSPGKLQSSINVTPLVDVVLVLLIIFMVIAPQLQQGPDLKLPVTDEPPRKTDDGRKILVAIASGGTIWIDREPVAADGFQASLAAVAEGRGDWQVVIKGDARLTFGEVKRAMLAIEAAGFKNVGLIAEQRDELVAGG